jgi:putative phosphoesterase
MGAALLSIVPLRRAGVAVTPAPTTRTCGLVEDGQVRLLLIADTHVPRRARDLPAQVWDEVAHADVVVHAGDWVVPALLDELTARSKRLVACWGNNDGPELRSRLPERADVVLGGLRFTVVHETGASGGREARMSLSYPDSDVLVFGHSHIPWDTTTSTGLRLLNPGSPTDRRTQPFCTYMTAHVEDRALTDVVLHRLRK